MVYQIQILAYPVANRHPHHSVWVVRLVSRFVYYYVAWVGVGGIIDGWLYWSWRAVCGMAYDGAWSGGLCVPGESSSHHQTINASDTFSIYQQPFSNLHLLLAGIQIWLSFQTPVEMEEWGIPLSPRCQSSSLEASRVIGKQNHRTIRM